MTTIYHTTIDAGAEAKASVLNAPLGQLDAAIAANLPALVVVGLGWALRQTDGSAPGGNNRGISAVDLQTARSAATQVASGNIATVGGGSNNTSSSTYATVGGGSNNTASGDSATVGGGSINTASGDYATVGGGFVNTASGDYATVGGGLVNTASGDCAAVVGGYYANADKYGQQAHAAGAFTAQGDAQRSVYVARNITTDATPTVLFLDGASAHLTIADDTVWNFRAEIVAMTADAAGYAAYTVTGLIRRANGTVTVHGVTTTTHAESAAAWDATATADDTNKALSIQVTGAAGTAIRWLVSVYTSELSFSS